MDQSTGLPSDLVPGVENGIANCIFEAAHGNQDELIKAASMFEIACSKQPDNVKFIRDQARCFNAMRKYDMACECLLKALALNEFDPTVLYELGLYSYADAKYNKVTHYLKRALKCDPDAHVTTSIFYHIGLAYARLQQFEKAIFPFTRCIEKDPSIVFVHERAKAF